jgi:tRNA(fMet)-specific endonuclease VapC
MILLDTDTLTHLLKCHARVVARAKEAGDVAITIITRIEVPQGRFASIVKAADGKQLILAQHWLNESERYINTLPIIPVDDGAAAQFDVLRRNKKLKKIGRGDLLIASIALAQKASVATRNLKDYEQVPGLMVENWAD